MLTQRELLEQEIFDSGLSLFEMPLAGDIEGVLIDNNIVIDSASPALKKNRVLRHELEHYYTCPYNLLKAPKALQDKMEHIAHRRTVAKLVPINSLIAAHENGLRCPWEIAESLEVDEEFLLFALDTYHSVYGYNFKYRGYLINFKPFKIEKCTNTNKVGPL